MRYKQRGLVAALALASAWSSAAEIALEEIIVTANRRETNLMETPVAVTAFDSQTREQLGIFTRLDLEARTPSLTTTFNKVSIRGVGRPNNALGSDPGVGIYWDGVYRTENGVFSYADYLDIERIEVLRGPQGTLYGRNSVGGAVKFISKKPQAEWGGELVAEVGNYETAKLQGLVSGPVTERLSILAAASQIQNDGYIENDFTGKDYGERDQTYGTFALRHQTTDNWATDIKLWGFEYDFLPNPGVLLEPFSRDLVQQVQDVDTGETLSLPGMFARQNFANMHQGLANENPGSRDPDKMFLDRDPLQKGDVWGLNVASEYSADTFTLRYIGGYSDYDYNYAIDADHSVTANSGIDWTQLTLSGIPVSNFTGYGITPADMQYRVDQMVDFYSHELQYVSNWDGAFNLIGGLYYYRSDEEQIVSYREFGEELMETYRFLGGLISGPVSDEGYLYRGQANLKTTSAAVYGQLDWALSERTNLTLGLRYSVDEKDGGDNTFVQFVGDPLDPTVFREEDDDWSQTTWRIGVDHIVADDHFLYGFIATGYRSGGFNFQKPTASPEVDQVDPEELISYEIGYKGSYLDGRGNVGLAAYFYDYQDIQVLRDEVINGVGLKTFENAEDAEAYGLEIEGQVLLTANLLLSGTYSWNHTEYLDFESFDSNACSIGPLAEGRSLDPLCTEPQDLAGNQFPLSPEHKGTVNLVYSWDLWGLAWSATGSYLYTGDSWSSQYNNRDYDYIDSYDRWDARLAMGAKDGTWQLVAWGSNLGDEREVRERERPSTVTHSALERVTVPRTYGLRLHYNF